MPNDPAVQAALDARAAHKAPERFDAEPSAPSAFATLDEALWDAYAEGRADEAEERESTPSGGPPLSETRKCARCNGRGEVYRPATRMYEYAVSPDDLGGYFECPECGGEGVFLIDDEGNAAPQFDAPGHPGARYTWGAR